MNSLRQNLTSLWGASASTSSNGPNGSTGPTGATGVSRVGGEENNDSRNFFAHVTTKDYWISDRASHNCYECNAQFNIIRRKHHCRVCGQIFCYKCCGIFIPGEIVHVTGMLRICSYCNNYIKEHVEKEDGSKIEESVSQIRNKRRFLPSNFDPFLGGEADDVPIPSSTSTLENFLLSDPQQLELLVEQIEGEDGVDLGSRLHERKMYYNSFSGEELVEWIRRRDKTGFTNAEVAKTIGQGLLDGGLIVSLNESKKFNNDSTPYKTVDVKDRKVPKEVREVNSSKNLVDTSSSDPDWMNELDTISLGTQYIKEPAKKDSVNVKNLISSSRTGTIFSPINLSKIPSDPDYNSTKDHTMAEFEEHYESYIKSVLSYFLKQANLDQAKWFVTIREIVRDVSHTVKPSHRTRGDTFDLREYVKIKKLSGGNVEECETFTGEVFSGRILIQGMRLKVLRPKILLISGSLSYHRNENRYVDLSALAQQEEEHLRGICQKVIEINPDIIFVENSVSGIARDILDKRGIVIIVNVKAHVLRRIARLIDTDVLSSIGSLLTQPKKGVAEMYRNERFKLLNGKHKDVVYVETKNKKLGCTIILRGGHYQELVKIKSIIHRLMLFECNAKYEKQILVAGHARAPKDHFFDVQDLNKVSLTPFVTVEKPEEDDETDSRHVQVQIHKPKKTSVTLKTTPENKQKETAKIIDSQESEKFTEFFQNLTITADMTEYEVADILADFRANADLYHEKRDQVEEATEIDMDFSYAFLDGLDLKALPVLFSSYAPSTRASPYHCITPWVISMQLYGKDDLPLGSFLETFCFSSAAYSCPNFKICNTDMTKHVRRFCHGNSFIRLHVQIDEHPLFPSSDAGKGEVSMWKSCKICKMGTPPIPMNYDMYMYSFTMFLFLHFYDKMLVRRGRLAQECQHSLHRDYVTCFTKGNETAVFDCNVLQQCEVAVPSKTIHIPEKKFDEESLRKEMDFLGVEGPKTFSQILNEILKLKQVDVNNKFQEKTQECLIQQERDHQFYRELQREINNYIQAKDFQTANTLILKSKIFLANAIAKWRKRLTILSDTIKNVKARVNSGSQFPMTEATTNNGVDGNETPSKKISAINSPHYDKIFTSPFSPNLHFTLAPNQKVVVDENQPSSIIAYVLSSIEYEDFLKMPAESKVQLKRNYQINFEDASCKFYCCVFSAREFHELRKDVIMSVNPSDFITSLSTCEPFQASGGKSGMRFFRTSDHRFLLKEMNNFEVDSFPAFSSAYFKYIDESLACNQPMCLAKIVGVYRVGFKNAVSGTSFKSHVLVIENVFHGRKLGLQYDLKGSIRNRMAPEKGSTSSLVLLDENLLRDACESPLYISTKSKQLLLKCIEHDSQFLARHLMMDYSLLVGKDTNNSELVLGIIDYIRSFTWDKKLETIVKSSGILGGSGKSPTVISPHLYMGRFKDAMYKYFIIVPDMWYQDPFAPANTVEQQHGLLDYEPEEEEKGKAGEGKKLTSDVELSVVS